MSKETTLTVNAVIDNILNDLNELDLLPRINPWAFLSVFVNEPFFEGKGNHSVAQLEAICEQYKEYAHQQGVIKKNCMRHIIELKFGVEI